MGAVNGQKGGLVEVMRWKRVLGIPMRDVALINGCVSDTLLCQERNDGDPSFLFDEWNMARLQLAYVALDVAIDKIVSALSETVCVAGGYVAARSQSNYHIYRSQVQHMTLSDLPRCVRSFSDIDVFLLENSKVDRVPSDWEDDEEGWQRSVRTFVKLHAYCVITKIVGEVCGVELSATSPASNGSDQEGEGLSDHKKKLLQSLNVVDQPIYVALKEANMAASIWGLLPDSSSPDEAYVLGVSDLQLPEHFLSRKCTIQLVQTSSRSPESVIDGFDLSCCAAFLAPEETVKYGSNSTVRGRCCAMWLNANAYLMAMNKQAIVHLTRKLFLRPSNAEKWQGNVRYPMKLYKGRELRFRMRKWMQRGYNLRSFVEVTSSDGAHKVCLDYGTTLSLDKRCRDCGKRGRYCRDICEDCCEKAGLVPSCAVFPK